MSKIKILIFEIKILSMNLGVPFLIHLKTVGDTDIGFLSIFEEAATLEMEIKRVYWTYNTPPETIRGSHSHKRLKQLLVAVAGRISISTETTRGKVETYILNKASTALYLPPNTWRNIEFSEGAVLLCLASEYYNENDYVRNYEEFKNIVKNAE